MVRVAHATAAKVSIKFDIDRVCCAARTKHQHIQVDEAADAEEEEQTPALKINANQHATYRCYSERAILSAVRDKVAKVFAERGPLQHLALNSFRWVILTTSSRRPHVRDDLNLRALKNTLSQVARPSCTIEKFCPWVQG